MTKKQKSEHARALWRRLRVHVKANKLVFLAQAQVDDNYLHQF